jgi:DnaJ-class molecular chaperone
MANSDFYQVLGVSKTATADEIRRAYRKLARENHPDVKKDDAAAAKRFQEIQEAYDVVGDAEKRKKYDQFGPNFEQMERAGGGFHPQGGQGPVDFSEFFGGGGGGAGGFDFGDLFGGGRRQRGPRGPVRGANLQARVSVPFETAVRGGSVDVQLDQGGRISTLGVKIPAGIQPDSVIRLAGQGEPSPGGGPPGDLLLTVVVKPHRFFRREGNDLVMDLPLSPSEAALGTKAEVPTLSDGPVLLTIPPGTSSGMKLRLRGKGVVDPTSKVAGDQFCVVKIVVPAKLSSECEGLYQKLRELEPKPREGLW